MQEIQTLEHNQAWRQRISFSPVSGCSTCGTFCFISDSHRFSAKYVCEQLGHSSIQMTFDTYGQSCPRGRGEASAKLEEAIRKGGKEAVAGGMLVDDDEINQKEESPMASIEL